MDIGTTVKAVRDEYKEYLRENNLTWSESTESTYASDSFYIWNNTICLSFWKCFMDEQSIEAASDAIFHCLMDVKQVDKAL